MQAELIDWIQTILSLVIIKIGPKVQTLGSIPLIT